MTTGSGPASDFRIQFRAPTFQASDDVDGIVSQDWQNKEQVSSSRETSPVERRPSNLSLGNDSSPRRGPWTPNVYLGSYGKAARDPRSSLRGSLDIRSPYGSAVPSPRASASHLQLQHLFQAGDVDLDTYGLSELRDGYFDASFCRPLRRDRKNKDAEESLPSAFHKHHPLSLRYFIPQQWRELLGFVESLRKYSSGLKLFKAFLGFFIAYVICLVPASRD